LTVVFTDLVSSTVLAASMDPEDWHEILADYQRQIAEVVAEHGGTVSQFQGDGVIAYFGWPKATGNDSSNAVAAGLAMVEAVREMDRTWPGLPVGLSARVGIHTGVAIVASSSVGGVERAGDIFGETPNVAARIQQIAAPGKVVLSRSTAELVADWFELEALGAQHLKGLAEPMQLFRAVRTTGIRSRLDRRSLTGFVGRERELKVLSVNWSTVVSEGEIQSVVVTGEAGIGKSRLVREFATGAVGIERIALIANCAERDSLSPLHPFRAAIPEECSTPREVVAWIGRRGASGPCLLLFEDAQWSDPSSLDVLGLLKGSGLPLMVVVTTRPPPAKDLLEKAERLTLEPLDTEGAAAFLRGASLSDEARARLIDRAGGVPLFLEELVRWSAVDPESTAPSLTEVITARIDQLGPERELVKAAAVAGTEFDATALCVMTGEGEDRIMQRMRVLQDQRIVEASETGYRFVHALIHDAAYDLMLKKERRRLHGLLADAITAGKVRNGTARPEVLAVHLVRADRLPEGVRAWERAGGLAASGDHFVEAAAHLTEALQCLQASSPGDDRDRLEARLVLARARAVAGVDQASPAVEVDIRRCIDLATGVGDSARVRMANLLLGPHYQARGDYAGVHRVLDVAAALSPDETGWSSAAVTGFVRGPVLVWQGRLDEGQALISSTFAAFGWDVAEPFPIAEALGAPATIRSHLTLILGSHLMYGVAEVLRGRIESAARYESVALEMAIESGSVRMQCMAWATLAMANQLKGDREIVGDLADKALALADDRTTAQFRSWASALGAWARGLRPSAPPRDQIFMRPYLLLLEADRTSDPHQAAELLAEALNQSRRSGERFCEAELLRYLARTRATVGDRIGARHALIEAAEVAHNQGALALETRARADWEDLEAGP
jgi:class 3 adenylate cyclase